VAACRPFAPTLAQLLQKGQVMSEPPAPISKAFERRVRCLLVDDEPALLRALRRLIFQRRPDWEIHLANSAADAIELLESRRFDCVMSDLCMPHMDGMLFLELVRERYPQTVRVVHSSHIETVGRDKVRAISHRMLPKPAAADAVIETLQWAIQLSRSMALSGTG